MEEKPEVIRKRLREVEAAIVETEKRVPAHSVKPMVMHDLFELEDERDLLLEKLAALDDHSEKPTGGN